MDKRLFKAYIKTIVEEEVERLLPKMIKEHVSKYIAENVHTAPSPIVENRSDRQSVMSEVIKNDVRSRYMQLMSSGDDPDDQTITMTGVNNYPPNVNSREYASVVDAVNKNYSDIMKALKLNK